VDWRSFSFSIVVAVGTAVLFGLFPALQATRGELHADLKEGTRGNSVRSSPLRSGLVIAQVALAAVSLIGALLFVKTFTNLDSYDVGFDTKPLMTMRFILPGDAYNSPEARWRRIEDISKRVEAIPGVQSAFVSNLVPIDGGGGGANVVIDGYPSEEGKEPEVAFVGVSPHFYRTLGVKVRGRDFTDAEGWSRTPVAIVNETMARERWPDRDAIGGRFRIARSSVKVAEWFEVIGVAPDIKHDDIDPDDEPFAAAYVPYLYQQTGSIGLTIRTAGPPAGITSAVREQVRQADSNLPIYNIQTMDDLKRLSFWEFAIFGWVFGTIGVVGLLLAAIGVYGVLSYSVNQRVQEIGVRVALGADRAAVLKLIVSHGMWLAGIGVALGLILAVFAMPEAQQFFFQISPYDALVYTSVAVFLLVVALLASALPALRATKVDPLTALRAT
jgi:predicted permease